MKFKLTQDSRRAWSTQKTSITVLIMYSRLKDMPEAVCIISLVNQITNLNVFFSLHSRLTIETFLKTRVEIKKNIVANGKRLKTKVASQELEKIALCEANYGK